MFTKLTHNDGAGAGFAGGSTAFCYGTAVGDRWYKWRNT